jgi:hypothetical protein
MNFVMKTTPNANELLTMREGQGGRRQRPQSQAGPLVWESSKENGQRVGSLASAHGRMTEQEHVDHM